MSSILIAQYNDALRSARAVDRYVAERAAAAADRTRADHGPEADAALAEARAWRADAEVRLVRARLALVEPDEELCANRAQQQHDESARAVAAAVAITDLLWQQVQVDHNTGGGLLRVCRAWVAAMDWRDRVEANLVIDEQTLRAAAKVAP